MSFPYHDRLWCDAADHVLSHMQAGDKVLAPDIFWRRFDMLHTYASARAGDHDFHWVIAHKGQLDQLPRPLLDHLSAKATPVLANPVFVIWTTKPGFEAIDATAPDLACLPGLLEQLDAGFEQQVQEDEAGPGNPHVMEKLEALDKDGLAERMDEFYCAGGYKYETLRDRCFYEEIDYWLKTFWATIEAGKVLDAACGDGRVARTVNDYTTMIEVDLSAEAVRLAALAGKADVRRSARQMDVENLDFPNESFDCVTFIEAMEHVHDVERAIGELSRVLRSGGALILNNANGDSLHQVLNRALGYPPFKTNHHHITELGYDDAVGVLARAGLQVERAEGITLYPYWGVPGVDEHVRDVTDNNAELVQLLNHLGRLVGPKHAYCFMLIARKR